MPLVKMSERIGLTVDQYCTSGDRFLESGQPVCVWTGFTRRDWYPFPQMV